MNNMIVIENDLVPVYRTSTGEKVVYGTELHEALEVKSNYRDWIKNRLSDCDADENEDYEAAKILAPSGQNKSEHIIKLDIAKEMAMLERNEKGRQVRRYFIRVDKKYKETKSSPQIEQVVRIIKYIADDLKMNEASKLLMYENFCKDYGIRTGFLPKYENNGSREMKSVTELLKRFDCGISASKFNQLLLKHGYLEERERASTKGNGTRKFKALSNKGLEFGENLVSPHNQREVQPYYYVEMFMELFNRVTK